VPERRERFGPNKFNADIYLGEERMRRRVVILCALLSCGLAGCKGKSAAETKIPKEEVERKNPVESNPASVAEGKRLYEATDCAICHGKNGDGKGFEAREINMNTHDWRKPESLAKFTDGELSYLIMKGKGRMPAYEGRQTPEQVWEMVNYIRSMSTGAGTSNP
jgi:mono/diheme cytochrome c family protein